MTRSPLVSVLIPVYNAGALLRSSVESILAQTYTNLEILIIDDGSTDDCVNKNVDLKDPRITVLSQDNGGKSVALNQALDRISGQFYAIQDADDLSYPTRIERQVACFMKHAEVAAVFSGFDLVIGDRRRAPRFRAKDVEECRRDIEGMRMPSHDPTVMFRVSMVETMRYEPSLRVGQGWDYILRVGEQHPMMVLGECLYSYHARPGSNTRCDAARRKKKEREVLRRACERRGVEMPKDRVPDETQNGPMSYRDREYGVVPHFMESVLDLRRAGRVAEALKTAMFCWKLHPFDPYYYKPLAYCAVPFEVIARHRRRKAERL